MGHTISLSLAESCCSKMFLCNRLKLFRYDLISANKSKFPTSKLSQIFTNVQSLFCSLIGFLSSRDCATDEDWRAERKGT